MQSEVITMAQRSEVDTICDHCSHEISVGQDYFYDHEMEEVLCEKCAADLLNDDSDISYL